MIEVQLKRNSSFDFFRERAIEALRSTAGKHGALRPGNFYIRISIDIVAPGAQVNGFKEGFNVSANTQPLHRPWDVFGSARLQAESFEKWITELDKTTEKTYTGIGIAFDFTVHYQHNRVRFGMQMGLPILKNSVRNLTPNLSWWQQKISDELGEYRPTRFHRYRPILDCLTLLKSLEPPHPSTIPEIGTCDLSPEEIIQLDELLTTFGNTVRSMTRRLATELLVYSAVALDPKA
jgi:hypothetical protein